MYKVLDLKINRIDVGNSGILQKQISLSVLTGDLTTALDMMIAHRKPIQ